MSVRALDETVIIKTMESVEPQPKRIHNQNDELKMIRAKKSSGKKLTYKEEAVLEAERWPCTQG